MKIFYTASTARHIKDFHTVILERLHKEGHAVTLACRDAGGLSGPFEPMELPYAKSFFSAKNIRTWIKIYRLFRRERFDAVLTHTALAGFLTRSALAVAGKKSAVCIHTAHGYLFGKGTPLTGKLTYPFERLCAPVTDAVFTMNAADAAAAKKLVRKGGAVVPIPGMGVDLERFRPAAPGEKEGLRASLGLPDGLLLLYAAEFSKRKNHKPLLRAMRDVSARHPGVFLLLAGDGKLKAQCRRLARKVPNILFLGYVPDTAPLLRACDGAVSPSLSEGLPHNIAEALASGLPVAASRVKGHTDLCGSENLFRPKNVPEIIGGMETLIAEAKKTRPARAERALCGKEEAAKQFVQYFTE
jgi:glycosyltransferase EpsD